MTIPVQNEIIRTKEESQALHWSGCLKNCSMGHCCGIRKKLRREMESRRKRIEKRIEKRIGNELEDELAR